MVSKPPAWAVRKGSYALVAVVVAVLGWAGIISEIDAGKITDQADQIITWLLGVITPAIAAAKTHPGSDSTATDEDRILATQAQAQQPTIDPDAVADAVITRWNTATTYGDHADQTPVATTPPVATTGVTPDTRSDIAPGDGQATPTVGSYYRK